MPPRYNAAEDVVGRPAAAGRAGDVAVRDALGTITFLELWEVVGRCAAGLARLGIGRGTTFLIRSPNCREVYVAFLAGLRLGAVPLLANSLLGVRELTHVVDNGQPAIAIVHGEAAGAVREIQRAHGPFRAVLTIGGAEAGELPFEALLEGRESAPTADTNRDDPAYICYTSGTTGLPKGIVHAHRWIPAHGDFAALHMPLAASDVVLHTSEVSFGWGLGHGFLWPLRNGGSIAALSGRATPERVLAAVEQHGVTVLATVPTLVRAVLAMPDAERRYRVGSLRLAYAAGEPLAEPTYRAWVQRFGCELYDAYGASELQVIVANGPGLPVKPGSMGRPNPGMVVAVVDECLNEVPADTIGSLVVRADDPGLFTEYRRQPDRWREAHRGGWYDTGDQVFTDADGYFWYVGRQDDLFKSRGYLISPKEIEDAIVGCPGVLEAAVVGRPDPEIGHRIVAFVVVQAGVNPSSVLADELRGAVRSLIAPYKVPHVIEFADSLPKSAVGKLLRRALREGTLVR